ncbi:hypothetical protein [Aquitalea denitrificans]|uniref:hypothetical protein n=1 Tax=Aquitalea denitrificans TaxID=519081 RepID=UPI00308436C3
MRSVAAKIAFVGCKQGLALVSDSLQMMASPGVGIRPLGDRLHVGATAMAWRSKRKNPLGDIVIDIVGEIYSQQVAAGWQEELAGRISVLA